jgi:ketosteroid isomerase-like protein
MSHAKVNHFQTGDHIVTLRGDTAVVEYRWEMAWTATGADHTETGRAVLVLARRDEGWRAVWRTPIPAPAPST